MTLEVLFDLQQWYRMEYVNSYRMDFHDILFRFVYKTLREGIVQ